MMLKDICLTLLHGEPREPHPVTTYASDLAKACHAALSIDVAVPRYVVVPDYPSIGLAAVEQREDARRLAEAHFWAKTTRLGMAQTEQRVSINVHADVIEPLLDSCASASRAHDLTITQSPAGGPDYQHDLVEALLVGSGGPVLLVPGSWTRGPVLSTVLVAWDGTAVSARAIRQMLLLTTPATRIELVSVIHESHKDHRPPAQEAMLQHLKRHCNQVEARSVTRIDDSVATTLRSEASLCRADLVVMGGYGHSRLREKLIGGTTRDMLGDFDVPVLLSH